MRLVHCTPDSTVPIHTGSLIAQMGLVQQVSPCPIVQSRQTDWNSCGKRPYSKEISERHQFGISTVYRYQQKYSYLVTAGQIWKYFLKTTEYLMCFRCIYTFRKKNHYSPDKDVQDWLAVEEFRSAKRDLSSFVNIRMTPQITSRATVYVCVSVLTHCGRVTHMRQ